MYQSSARVSTDLSNTSASVSISKSISKSISNIFTSRDPYLPPSRESCESGSRPCPIISCRHHIIWAMSKKIWKRSDSEIVSLILSLSESCVLDVAEYGGLTQERVGELLHISRQRVTEIESGVKNGGKSVNKNRARNARVWRKLKRYDLELY